MRIKGRIIREKIVLFLGPFDMKNGFDAKWIFGKKPFFLIFMTKMVFFPV